MRRNERARSSSIRSISHMLMLALVPVLILLMLAFSTSESPEAATAAHPALAPTESDTPLAISRPESTSPTISATSTPLPDATVSTPATVSPSATFGATPPVRSATATPLTTATTIVTPTVPAIPTSPAVSTTPAAPAVPTATEAPRPAALARLVIPSIGVDSAIEVKGLNADGVMDSPSGPAIVTWYDFSSQPVDNGNAVFAGHLDYAGYGPAVFWRLGDLRAGDVIEVVHEDGVVVRYSVALVQPFDATADATNIVASTGASTITIITCEGTFDQVNRVYHERLVVTGVRIG